MVERKMFILESYYARGSNKQMWRNTTPAGINWYASVDNFTFVSPEICRPGVVEQVSGLQALLESSGDKW